MASGQFHKVVNVGVLVSFSPFLLVTTFTTNDLRYTLFLFGLLLSIYITPDLDLTTPNSKNKLWELLWLIYRNTFAHGGISHWFIVGTLTRIIYIMILLSPLFLYFNIDIKDYWVQLIGITGGMVLGDTFHIILDIPNGENKPLGFLLIVASLFINLFLFMGIYG